MVTGSGLIALAQTSSQFIDGVFRKGKGATFDVENPATGEVIARVAEASIDQVSDCIASARREMDGGAWSLLKPSERTALLRRFVAALTRYSAEITDVEVAEAGVVRHSAAMLAQVPFPLRQGDDILDIFESLPEFEENPLPLEERTAYGRLVQSVRSYAPVGVVAGIASYNFPFFTALWKVMPALATGNCIILRPSPLTPISALVFGLAAQEAGLPPGVVSVVIEQDIEGARLLTTDVGVDMVAFTGSSSVGQQVLVQSAATMKRIQLELGGKSAQIFLPDAFARAGRAAADVCFAHAGQGCSLGTRIFVPEERKAEVLAAAASALESAVLGDPNDVATTMAPVISAAQVRRCEHFVDLAVQAGAKIVAGGKRPTTPEQGYYFEPTILDVPDNSNPAAQEEIFGPVVCVIGYRDIEQAIEMANDSPYGLAGHIFGADPGQCLSVAKRLRTGTVNINGVLLSAYVSAGGQRLSGVARERGIEGVRLYQQMTCINLTGA